MKINVFAYLERSINFLQTCMVALKTVYKINSLSVVMVIGLLEREKLVN